MISKLPLKKWLGAHSSPFLLFTMIAAFPCVQAQMHVNGKMYIASGSAMYVSQGNVTFGTTAELTTQKRLPFNSLDGRIILGGTSVFDTDGTVPKFVNGYAATTKITSTLLATGSTSVYAPVMVVPSTNTGVQAAYFNQSPTTTIGSTLNQTVREIANTEFWIVKGTPSILTLSWRSSSNLSGLVFPDVVIVGYKNGAWEEIPSAIDTTSKFGGTSLLNNSGSITSLNNVVLNDYDAFAIGEKGVSCAELVASSGDIKIWDGTAWIGGVPTLADPVQLNANYSGGSFACNSIDFNGFDVVLTGTDNLELVNGTSGSGKIVMSSESSLVQRNSNATVPQIELTKTTRPIKRFDYVYWGVPINENAFSQLENAHVTGQAAGAYDLKYKYVSGITGTLGGWQSLTTTQPGQGFIMRVKPQAPFVDATTTNAINLKFTGTANNGDITINIAKVAGNDTSARNNNLLANPYPSAIDVDKFLTENNAILDGVVYLWRASTANATGTAAYSVADYLAYTKAGTTGYLGTTSGQATFDGKIASGQGFKVRALSDGTAKFTNCMRVLGNNSQFYRPNEYATNSNVSKDRFRVRLETTSGVANQILVAYLPETTLAYDNMYDAQLYTVSPVNMYSLLDNSSRKLAINARPSFVNTDQVSIGFRKENSNLETLHFNIQDKEGVFASALTKVYLFDSLLNHYHDFANGAYSFATSEQENNTRFKIVYQNGTLGNDDFNTVRTFMKLDKQNLSINSENNISKVYVYDITGRLILEKSTINASQNLEIPFVHAEGVYIVKVKLETGAIVTSKLINKN